MKYITQDWTSTKDGYLFFVQRLQEMLFHYSDDIVKAPVHNTQTLLEEYVDTEKDVVKGSIRNAIVHAGESHKRIQMLGEHLHIYVDRVILELMVKLAKDKCLGTIQDVFTDTYLLLNKKKKNLKEPGNVDEQSIMLLLENFFIEE